jgi:hypothetical protein
MKLLEEFVLVEALGEAERAELHGLGHDRRLGHDRTRGVLHVVRDAVHEQRHVVEQVVAGEDPDRVDRDAGADPAEPARRQRLLRLPEPRGEDQRERALIH